MFGLYVFDMIGTIVFAISGALVGIKKELDLFGVIILAICTASWGGLSRDVIIGNLPPTLLKEPQYIIVCITTALITFMIYPALLDKGLVGNKNRKLTLIVIFDSIGLAAFTVLGSKIAIDHGMNSVFSVIAMGMLTGVGGGVIRDVFVRDIPKILVKDIYASASAIGGLSFYISNIYLNNSIFSLYIGFCVTIFVHLMSVYFNIHLPKAYRHKQVS